MTTGVLPFLGFDFANAFDSCSTWNIRADDGFPHADVVGAPVNQKMNIRARNVIGIFIGVKSSAKTQTKDKLSAMFKEKLPDVP